MRYCIAVCLSFIFCLVPVSAVEGDTSSAPDTSEFSQPLENTPTVDTSNDLEYPASDTEDLLVPDVPSELFLPQEESPMVDTSNDLEYPASDTKDLLVPDVPSVPQEVIVVDPAEIAEYPVISYSASTHVGVIGDDPPTSSPFYGSGWVTGSDSNLGIITLYFPRNYCTDTWGVDSNGYLINVTSSSVGGYYSGSYNNSVSAPSFSYPRYRPSRDSDYIDIHLVPLDSNMDIYTSHRPRKTIEDLLPYVSILLIGGVLVCCMRRSSS